MSQVQKIASRLTQKLQNFINICGKPAKHADAPSILPKKYKTILNKENQKKENKSITKTQHKILRSTLGFELYSKTRNGYVARENDIDCNNLVDHGLMFKGKTIFGDLMYYHATNLGKTMAKISYEDINDMLLDIESMLIDR